MLMMTTVLCDLENHIIFTILEDTLAKGRAGEVSKKHKF